MSSTNGHSETTSIQSVDKARKIFEEYEGFIRKTIQFRLGNGQEAEDLFQDIFVFLVSKPLPEDVRSVPSYLYRVITARIIDKLRHETYVKAVINKYAVEKGLAAEKPGKESVGILMAEEKSEKMFELVQKNLSKNEALAITLRYKHDLDINQTADKMGIKARSVSRYLSVGINKLRCIAKDKFEEKL